MSATGEASHPPVNMLKPVAENVWVVDGDPIQPAGIPMPVRMTVIRLHSGDLWLHSPTRLDAGLVGEIEALGTVHHLVAPNIAHWSFVQDWQKQFPVATTWAPANLRRRRQVRKAGLRIDRDLQEEAPEEWSEEIEQFLVPGGAGFQEVAFFHRSTRTLVLTDLIVNLEREKAPLRTRVYARLAGTLAPKAATPVYLRLLIRMRRREAVAALARVVDREPEKVVFAHGRWFESDGTRQLKHALRWLLQ